MICDFMNPHKISAHSDNKQKSFIPKKTCGMLLFETLKNQKSDFLNSNTCFCLRLYGKFSVLIYSCNFWVTMRICMTITHQLHGIPMVLLVFQFWFKLAKCQISNWGKLLMPLLPFLIEVSILVVLTLNTLRATTANLSQARLSTPNFFDRLFLIRVYWNPKSRQGPGLGGLASRGGPVTVQLA